MSFFKSTETTHHVTVLPPGTDRATAIAVLQDHEAMMRFGPHLKDLEALPTDPEHPEHAAYQVTDIMDMLPKGLWSSNVVSTYYYRNTADGVEMIIKAPLDVLMSTRWAILPQDDGLIIDEDVTITCSRLLMGTVRSQCDGNYMTIHGRVVERVKQRQAEQSSTPAAA